MFSALKETAVSSVGSLKEWAGAKVVAVVALATVGATSANAALPAGAADAITAYQTDVVSVFGLIIAAGIAIYAVRKLGSKMGWL